ncbi:MAG: bifunctional [glutamate--ammonia ligase]-adenylyl-L-tyrosine phosphorylase/[glutamate--ammonia-ligase] adenylyltransferase [Tatlockia sp.]|nr:bifunctional [glutamate--ammonia ligase]-adenylyl-L-tyrosine phosphorylase/[glutamate--ammonia-ligase] adenylyltransferase [Tatlockia sp.]
MQNQPQIPDILKIKMKTVFKNFAELDSSLSQSVLTLLLSSDFASRNSTILSNLLAEDNCQKTIFFCDYQSYLSLNLTQPNEFYKNLRQFRHRFLLRLMLRELAGLANTEETMASWSDFADAIILKTLDLCQLQNLNRYGKPRDELGNLTELYVLAMGKLGGQELNYSSDIDLIFVYSAAGFTDGKERISNQEYYSKVVQQFVHFFQTVTAEGFVFRVDLRLRPNGDSGALVSSLAAMEIYYQEQGRDWERYAMVKARLLGSTSNVWFQQLIIPFVYKRYIDFSVIESLRSMKAMIELEVQLNPLLDDIKRGFGGIREIEFIIQTIQLIRGGRLPQLRQQNAMTVLENLEKENLLSHSQVLKQAYLFLRKLENSLQGLNDQQTHSLPKDELKQTQITLAMGYENWQQLSQKLAQYQRITRRFFCAILRKDVPNQDQEKKTIAHQLLGLWQGHIESTMACNLLASLNFPEAERCYQMLYAFKHGARCRRLSQAARLHLDRFMPLLLNELTKFAKADELLLHSLHLLEKIVARSAYLALLTENPGSINELLQWFSQSSFIRSLILNQPFLLEILLHQDQNWQIPSYKVLEQSLKAQLNHCQEEELQADLLRQFKLSNWLLAARAEIKGQYSAARIARFLAMVAEIIVIEILERSCQQLASRYPQILAIKSRFAIIAYGKLGSKEMTFASDLDLVFVHKVLVEEEPLVTRLTQKIMHMLTTRTQAGILYAVDTRLRPSGSAGLLISHIDSFIDYQLNQAWTWEHQALVCARMLSAKAPLRHAFKQMKKEILLRPRDKVALRNEILAMRAKINHDHNEPQAKYAAGGLIDLEFLLQFLILANPHESFVFSTNYLILIKKLHNIGILNHQQCIALKSAYLYFCQALYQNLLEPELDLEELPNHLARVILLCQDLGFKDS